MMAESRAESSSSPFPDVEALLAAGQPRSAVRRALARLGAATAAFASSVGMQVPGGNELERAASVLGRVARACVNPSLSARAMQGHGLLLAASPHVAVQDITAAGARLAIKAAGAALPILASPEMVRHVKAGAAAHLLAGRDVLALQEAAPRASGGTRRPGWPVDPLLATCSWCMLGLAWSGLGLLEYALTLTQALVCCGWLLGMYVAWKARGWARVKEAIARWKSPARIPARAALLAVALAASLLLPVTVKLLRYAPAGFAADEPSSLLAVIADQHPTPYMYLVDVVVVAAAGIAMVSIISGILARKGDDEARVASFGRWRAISGLVTMALWIAVLAWLASDRVFFPGTTFVEGAGSLVRVEVGWGWLAIGLLGILSA